MLAFNKNSLYSLSLLFLQKKKLFALFLGRGPQNIEYKKFQLENYATRDAVVHIVLDFVLSLKAKTDQTLDCLSHNPLHNIHTDVL